MSHGVGELAGSDDVDACAVSSCEDVGVVRAGDCSCARPHEVALAVGGPAGSGGNLGGVFESTDRAGKSDEACSVGVRAHDFGVGGQPFQTKEPHCICAGQFKSRRMIADLHRGCIAPQERDVRSPSRALRQVRGKFSGQPM